MKKLRILSLLMLLLIIAGCDDDPVSNLQGSLKHVSDCLLKNGQSPNIPATMSCISYTYNGTLSITHNNAVFNCCPGDLSATFNLEGDTIYITEAESSGMCDCMCLYDLDFEITNLPAGIYVLHLNEPYISDQTEILECTIDLLNSSSGSYCVPRTNYPYTN